MNAKIIVATHKKYWMPADDLYLPLHVGAANGGDLGYAKDDTGDNISAKNKNYCELTGLYWAWKNLEADIVGLAHYRRHFVLKKMRDKKASVLTGRQLKSLLAKGDVILPKKRNYFVETNYSQYIHAHHREDLDVTEEILAELYPQYLAGYQKVMARTTGHRFNMFIMKRASFDAYCEWLFSVLFELEKRLDISAYSPYDARVFGFVSERLLDVWLETNAVAYEEIPYVFLEKQNWLVKGARFVARKFSKKT